MRTVLATAAAAVLAAGFAAPAMAEPKSAPPAPIVGTETREDMADDQIVCVKKTPTGSRVARKVCKTQAEWANEDVNPLAPRQ
ncbi:hypothetical protein ABS767_10745 [Sphingomonas sp. ST-64]|uniref:Uncharacterized protein n=1 Tax=Sphingomonas plantiphila TaxID=3163295 RepID=A0ABW8YP79_9SPHN